LVVEVPEFSQERLVVGRASMERRDLVVFLEAGLLST
jgi:hypothetical protein